MAARSTPFVEGVKRMYDAHSKIILERVWQRIFNRYNQSLRALERNDFELERAGARKATGEGVSTIPRVDRGATAGEFGSWADNVDI